MRFSTLEKKAKLVKNRLQKISKFVSAQITLSETQSLNVVSIQRLHNYDDEVRGLFSDFKALFDKVVYDDPGSDYDETEACSMQDEISDLYISLISDLKIVLPAKTKEVTPPTQPSLRLPKFELPKFSGNYEEWVSYYNIFEASINRNETLAPVSKFQYLLSSLSGEPLDLVKSLSITAENFDVALRLLKDRYDNKRRVVTQLVTKIIDLPCISSGSLKSLQHFLTVYKENTQVLKNLNHDITAENTLLVLTLLKKLPTDLRKSFEDSRITNNDIPAVNDLIQFLEREFKRLEGASIGLGPSANARYPSVQKTQSNSYRPKPLRDSKPYSSQAKTAFVTVTNTCKFCQASDHNIYKCQAFQAKSRGDRVEFTCKNNLCANCLGHLHDTNNCPSHRVCRICSKRHHTLLHDSTPTQQQPSYPTKVFEKKYGKPPTNNAPQSHVTAPVNKSALVGLSSQLNPTKTTILLGTCLVQVFTKDGQQTVLRAVLDSASQLTLISERAVQLISASRTRAHDEIQGISGSLIHSRGIVHIDISAVNGQRLAYHHPCLVLNRITSPLPQIPVSPQVKGSLNDFVLADPCFDKPGEIDLLIGADLFALSLTGEQHFLGHNLPQVLGTIFGFVVMGIAPVATSELSIPKTVSFLTTHDGDLHSSIQRFWSIEEPPTCVKTQSEEDVLCLQHFERTHTRDNSGRYVVKLPKRPNHPLLGESCSTAQLRLKAMERKFAAQPEFKDLYSEFMDDYIKSGHMSTCEQPLSGECYYLPHHGVFKENPPNSKIRVVFNGSSKTNNGVSLNDILMPGPKLQNDISDVLLYFRCHKFVFTCDIRQMYRQILVAEDDKKYQLIFWRSNPDESLQVLKLNTVTYGLNCSPFIAIRTLQQLVKDEGHSYPKASEILTKSIFYDDIIAGAESLDEALSAQNELKNLLSRGGFELRKWISNAPQLLDQVPIEHKETPVELTENSEAFFSVLLGLKWTPESDMLSYKVKDVEISAILTKRRILSTIAKLYDLPGFLTPVIFWAKTLIQYLWTTGLTWDEPVPNDVRTKWHSFLEELPIIQELRIPRYISTSLHTAVQLHGFSDTSEKGYAAVVYLRVTDSQENTRLYLIVSKSKVAPLKIISLPRLELCGAHLLGKLLQYSSNILSAHMKIESIYAWCDSTIVLTWIRTLLYRLKVFIANRISELQELVSPHSWNYVKSQDNPADCATRGLSPSQLVTHLDHLSFDVIIYGGMDRNGYSHRQILGLSQNSHLLLMMTLLK
ncbi:uncharacterized protein LOC128982503 [Macrosteles quadrilineatus]|uniref:uncharacterized protein LOC128982503 n=1 Tax=Macrosteles quadrilineatus TaxID=74068 RepID=UPI0023E30D66|nr:uncharacterized protein LOC128982503 [Macrosteles quadrilineatus]